MGIECFKRYSMKSRLLAAFLTVVIMFTTVGSDLGKYPRKTVTVAKVPYTYAALTESTGETMTAAMKEKAEELKTPLLVYLYIKNNIEYELYYKSKKGATGTFTSNGGNDADQASLLIGMLRHLGYEAQYIKGTIRLTPEQAMALTNTTDAQIAADNIAASGNPCKIITKGKQITAIEMEHIWIEVNVPYSDYRGAGNATGEMVWIPLDTSIKIYDTENRPIQESLEYLPLSLQYEVVQESERTDEIEIDSEEPISDPTDKTPPVAEITGPEDDVLTQPTDITGSAYDEKAIFYYILEYRLVGTKEYIEFARSQEAKENAVLGNLDTTILMNGLYEIRLTVKDKGGNYTQLTRTYAIEGDFKVGNMNIGFTDITANIGGTSINVNRMYDSRNKTQGDFGIGWTLGMQGMTLSQTNDLYDGYEMIQSGSIFSTTYTIVETKRHDVVVAYGDGTSDRFTVSLSPQKRALIPIQETSIGFQCVTNPKVKLEIVGDNTALVYSNGLFPTGDTEDIQYKLTTAKGIEIYLTADKGVSKMVDLFDNEIIVSKDGYQATNGKSIAFTRDNEGRIVKAEDPVGNVTSYTYDNNGDLVTVTDSADRTVTFTYDKKHNLLSITDPMGIAVSRNEYDENGRLIAVIDADGNRITYDYDIDGRTQAVKDRRGNTTVYTYDDNGNILQTVDALGNKTINTFDANNNMTSTIDALGNRTDYAYDALENITKVTCADGTTLKSDYTEKSYVSGIQLVDKKILSLDYDSKGNMTSVTDAKGNETTYEYEKSGKLTGITDAIGVYQKVTYDGDGNVITSTNGAGETTTYTYDKDGRCLTATITRNENGETKTFTSHYTYNATGNITQSVDNAGNVTTYEYDANGNQTASIDTKGRRITYTYDDLGNVVTTTYPDGTFETFTYDANGNNLTATGRSGLTVTMKYDKLNRMSEKINADGTKETYTYDAVGNVVSRTNASGATTTYTYDNCNRNTVITDAMGNATTFYYDEASRLTERTDTLGNSVTYDYDDNGNVIKTTDALGNSVKTEYDARNRITQQENQYKNRTKYEYDGADRLIAVTDALGESYTYAYDENGNLITVTDALGHATTYTYDSLGRMVTMKNALGKVRIYTYDETGNVTKYQDYDGTVTITVYNDMDRLIKKTVGSEATTYTYDDFGKLITVKDKSGTITYVYDKYNRISTKTDAYGNTLTYTYDKVGRLQSLDNGYGITTYEYDLLDRMTKAIDRDGKVTIYEYDVLGNRSAVKYANGVTMTYTYDACQRLKEEWVTDKDGNTISKYSYELGKAGERLNITEIDYEGTETEISYSYDDINRLTREVIKCNDNQLTNEYKYDVVSNRIQKETKVKGDAEALARKAIEEGTFVEGKTEYTYNDLNQLITETNDNLVKTYTYDDKGNLVKQTGDKNVTYTYSSDNHLLSAKVVNGSDVVTETYAYDYEGNRIKKVVSKPSGKEDGKATENVTTKYVVDTENGLSHVTAETDEKGSETAYYTLGEDLIFMEKAGNICYYIYDGHGSTRALTNEAGKVTDTYSYDAYGITLTKTGDTENEYLYSGEQYNANTGLYYLRARYMNPSTGTFISMDSYEGSIYDPITLHKYLYANANPVTYTDPTGYFSVASLATCTTASQILSASWKFIAFSTIMGAVTGAALGAVDSMLGGNDFSTVLQDAFKGACSGALLGCVISSLTCFAVLYPQCLIALEVCRYVLLVTGGVGAIVSIAEGHPAQAIFRTILGLFAFKSLGKTIGDVKLVRLSVGKGAGGAETKTFLPDEYYNQQLPKQVSPGTKSLPKYDEFGNLKQIKYYDNYGREIGWVDYSNHGFPNNHTVPHWHEVQYSAQYPFGIKYNHRMNPNPPFK